MSRIGTCFRFTARAGERERVAEHLLSAAEILEAFPGCELYLISTSPAEPHAVWVFEVWNSPEDHAASLSLEGIPTLIEATLPLLDGPPEQTQVSPLGGKGLARRLD